MFSQSAHGMNFFNKTPPEIEASLRSAVTESEKRFYNFINVRTVDTWIIWNSKDTKVSAAKEENEAIMALP